MVYSGTPTPGTISIYLCQVASRGKKLDGKETRMRTALVPETGKMGSICSSVVVSSHSAFLPDTRALLCLSYWWRPVYIVVLAAADLRHGGLKGDGRFPRAQGPWESKRSGIRCVCFRHLQRPRGLSFFHSPPQRSTSM
ncbi:hypothetical protein CKAH01_13002 [Colletotrichum kahawae]|uniref:Uncharacterized protein n=1 Tax=Colletotrichum kahawae TaxID=34407 RepID=A0AAE0DAG5_COLKA|nr:hypothetical protein CKAH01_13002 [Colletotrichum kahawae]